MKKINIKKDIRKEGEKEIKGWQPKFWGVKKNDNKSVLVKYDQLFRDPDSGQRYFLPNARNEIYASKVFNYLGIPCAEIESGYDPENKKRKDCVVVENFLKENEELIEIEADLDKVGENYSFKDFIEKTLSQISEENQIPEDQQENIKQDMVKLTLGDCLIGQFDRYFENIGVIHNKDDNSYRLAPAYDNGRAFETSTNINVDKIVEGIFKDYMPYVEEMYSEKIKGITSKTTNKIFGFGKTYMKKMVENNARKIGRIYGRVNRSHENKDFKNNLKLGVEEGTNSVETTEIKNIEARNIERKSSNNKEEI